MKHIMFIRWTVLLVALATATSLKADPPEAPSLYRIQLGQQDEDGRMPITVWWSPTDPTLFSFEIWFRPAGDPGWEWAIQDQANVQQEVRLLTPDDDGRYSATFNLPWEYVGTNIDIGMRARRTTSQCSVSDNCSDWTAFEVRAASPEAVTAVALDASTVRIDWTLQGGTPPPSQFLRYQFHWRQESDGGGPITSAGFSTDASDQSWSFVLAPEQTYTLFVELTQNLGGPYVHSYTGATSVTLSGASSDDWDAQRAHVQAGAILPTSESIAGDIIVSPGPGSPIRAAIVAASPGDVIVVSGGTYRESLGWINKELTITAASGELPVISGAERRGKQDWSQPDANGVRSIKMPGDVELPQPPIPFPLNQVDGEHPAAGQLEQLFWVDQDGRSHPVEQFLWQHPNYPDYGNNPPPGGFTYNPNDNRLYANFTTQQWQPATGFEISVRTLGARAGSDADGLTLVGLQFTQFASKYFVEGNGVLEFGGQSGNPIEDVELIDVEVVQSAGQAISFSRASRPILNRVTASDNGALGAGINRADGLRIEYSRFDNNNAEGFSINNCGANCKLAGVKITWTGLDVPGGPEGLVIRYSSFSDNAATGLWCDLDCYKGILVGNWVANNDKHGMYWEVSRIATLASNVVIGNAASGIKMSGSRDLEILYNTLYLNGAQFNIGADYRPNSIPFHTDAASHMREINMGGNLVIERQDSPNLSSRLIVNPVNPTAPPNQSGRLAAYTRNAYALVSNSDSFGPYRFQTNDGTLMRTPDQFAANVTWFPAGNERVWTSGTPLSVVVDASNDDFRISSDVPEVFDWDPKVDLPAQAAAELDLNVGPRAGAILSPTPFSRPDGIEAVQLPLLRDATDLPRSQALGSAFPNPFWASVTLPVTLMSRSDVEVTLVDAVGREVMSRTEPQLDAGQHDLRITPDGISSGLYLVIVRVVDRQSGSVESSSQPVIFVQGQ